MFDEKYFPPSEKKFNEKYFPPTSDKLDIEKNISQFIGKLLNKYSINRSHGVEKNNF